MQSCYALPDNASKIMEKIILETFTEFDSLVNTIYKTFDTYQMNIGSPFIIICSFLKISLFILLVDFVRNNQL